MKSKTLCSFFFIFPLETK